MVKKQSAIMSACAQVLADFGESKPEWKYLKSSQSFKRKVSKLTFVDIYTGMISKVDFVKFQFSLHGGHSYIRKVEPFNTDNWAITWMSGHWTDPIPHFGMFTVYDHHRADLSLFEDKRAQGESWYVRLEDFGALLADVFARAEAEIDRVFDISSEAALIGSWIDKPIGRFRPNEVLLIQLMLDNPGYYDELRAFYDRPKEEVYKREDGVSYPIEAWNRSRGDQLLERYRRGDLPRIELD